MSELRASIRQQISEALDDVLADGREQSSETSRQSKAEHLNHAQHVLDACTTEELRSESALGKFLETTLRNARVRFCTCRRRSS
jgi:hypothetical protein